MISFYFEDEFGGHKTSKTKPLHGEFQLENVSTAIATARQLNQIIK